MFASPSPLAIFAVPMSILINLLLGLWIFVALLMVLVILMQRPKSEGLGAAFGGAVTENIFGAQTTNVLVKFTAWLAGFFFVLTFVLSILYARKASGDSTLWRGRAACRKRTASGFSAGERAGCAFTFSCGFRETEPTLTNPAVSGRGYKAGRGLEAAH